MLTPEEFNKLTARLALLKLQAPVQVPEEGSISRAFGAGTEQAKAGYEQARTATNPLDLLRGGTKLAAGAINTVLSPLAPVGEFIDKTVVQPSANVISDIPAVQKFAGTKAGEFVASATEDIGNLATIAGTVAGGIKAPQIAGKVTSATTRGAGGALKGAGEKLYGITITPEESTRIAMQNYQAKQGSLFNRVKNMIKGEEIEGKPITEAETAARKGLAGTEWKLGVQSKQVADDLWTGKIGPALDKVKGNVSMKSFFNELEKEIKKIPELGKKNIRLESLEALKQEYKNVGKIGLKKLQEYKEGWAETVPEASYKGKPIASSLKDVKNMAAEKARKIIYKYADGDDIKQAYIDYGNLKSIQKAGIKSIKDPAAQSLTRNVWQFIMDKTITPVATISGKILYKTGEGLEFIGGKGARKVKDIINSK